MHEELLHSVWVVMAADVEVARHLVNENESTKLAPFLVLQSLGSLSEDLLGLALSLHRLPVILAHFVFSIDLRMALLIDVLDHSDLLSKLVKPMLMELSFDIDDVHPSNINDIQTEDVARAIRQRNIEVDVQLLLSRVDIDHDLADLLVLNEVVHSLTQEQPDD